MKMSGRRSAVWAKPRLISARVLGAAMVVTAVWPPMRRRKAHGRRDPPTRAAPPRGDGRTGFAVRRDKPPCPRHAGGAGAGRPGAQDSAVSFRPNGRLAMARAPGRAGGRAQRSHLRPHSAPEVSVASAFPANLTRRVEAGAGNAGAMLRMSLLLFAVSRTGPTSPAR